MTNLVSITVEEYNTKYVNNPEDMLQSVDEFNNGHVLVSFQEEPHFAVKKNRAHGVSISENYYNATFD